MLCSAVFNLRQLYSCPLDWITLVAGSVLDGSWGTFSSWISAESNLAATLQDLSMMQTEV